MRITIFDDVKATSRRGFDVPWQTVIEQATNPPTYPTKAACPLIKLAAFGDTFSQRGSLRHDGNVIAVSGIECDYDAGLIAPGVVAAMLQGVQAVIYTSPSHAPSAPRWRVLAPLSREVAPHERREYVGRLNGILGGILAHESFTLSQTFYIGRVAGAAFEAYVCDGQPIDQINVAPMFPATHAPVGPHEQREATAETIAELQSALLSIPTDDYNERIAVGQALSCLGDAGLVMWYGWLGDRTFAHETHSKWETFTGDRTGFEAVFAKAQRYGWENPKARKQLDLTCVFQPVNAPTVVPGGGFANVEEQQALFAGCVYVQDLHAVMTPGGWLLDKQRFDVKYGGYLFTMDMANSKTSKSAWEVFTQSQAVRFPRADSWCFRPEFPPTHIVDTGGFRRVNTWWPIQNNAKPGDVTPFMHHMELLLPDERDRMLVLAYMAATVQHPGEKLQWSPVIQGAKGNGKTLILTVLEAAIGERYYHALNSSDLSGNGGKFTGWLRQKLAIGVEEISAYHKREVLEILKPLITNTKGEIQSKGVDQTTGDNRANFFLMSNFKEAVPIDIDERRYAVFYTAQQSAEHVVRDMGGRYFPDLYRWVKSGGADHVAHWLMTWDIPVEYCPVRTHHRAPETSSTEEAIAASLGPIEQDIIEAIERGDSGFRGGWVSSIMLGALTGRKITPNRLADIMRSLGYVVHPHLPNGRTNNAIVHPDNGKPRLFLKQGHLALNETRAIEVARMYQQAQGMQFNESTNTQRTDRTN
jgi:hypothetical protein